MIDLNSSIELQMYEFDIRMAELAPFDISGIFTGYCNTLAYPDDDGRKRLITLVHAPHRDKSRLACFKQYSGIGGVNPEIYVAVLDLKAICAERKRDKYIGWDTPEVMRRSGVAIVESALRYVEDRAKATRRLRRPDRRKVAAQHLRLFLEATRMAHDAYRLGAEIAVPTFQDIAPDMWEHVEDLYRSAAARALPPREPDAADVEALSSLAPW